MTYFDQIYAINDIFDQFYRITPNISPPHAMAHGLNRDFQENCIKKRNIFSPFFSWNMVGILEVESSDFCRNPNWPNFDPKTVKFS